MNSMSQTEQLLASLTESCQQLQPTPASADPGAIGETPAQPGPFDGLPTFQPLPADLPPQMAAALGELRKALTEPPSLGDQWPFANPPAVQAALDKQTRRGRPSAIQPNQVVRLARFIRLGDSVSVAAGKAGLKERDARRVLSGQCAIAHHPAVTAAGVDLPPMRRSAASGTPGETPAKTRSAAIEGEAMGR